jgi:pimeloyl-ACP methyl ester carboxylesterase
MASDHLVHLPDGRTLGVADTGPASAPVVVLCPPAPGSRLLDPDPSTTASAGIRLVTVERAGYGVSSPLPDDVLPTISGHAEDLVTALHVLGLSDVAMVGWSAGGRVAAATCARHPDLVRALAVVATPAPHEVVPWIPEDNLAMLDSMRDEELGATAQLAAALAPMAADPRALVADIAVGPADAAALAAVPGRAERLEAMLVEAFAGGAEGLAADIVSYTLAPWGFELADIGCRTTAFYGADDHIVGPAHGEWYASGVPHGELRTVGGVGHLVAITAWGDILDSVR